MTLLPKLAVLAPFGSVWQWVGLAALSLLHGDAGANVFGPPSHTS